MIHAIDRLVRRALWITAPAAFAILCAFAANSALQTDGFEVGRPKLIVEYINTPAQITSGAAATQSAPLLQLAAFDAAHDAQRQRKQRSR